MSFLIMSTPSIFGSGYRFPGSGLTLSCLDATAMWAGHAPIANEIIIAQAIGEPAPMPRHEFRRALSVGRAGASVGVMMLHLEQVVADEESLAALQDICGGIG